MVVKTDLLNVPEVVIEEVTDPVENERARAHRARANANWEWFWPRVAELAVCNRGRYVCVAGQQAFIADTPVEAVKLAREAHPDDDGRIRYYFRPSNLPVI